MKTSTAFLLGCSLLFTRSIFAQHQVTLCGIVNVPGHELALLDVDAEHWTGSSGDHFKGHGSGRQFEIDLEDVNVTNETVRVRIDDTEYTDSLHGVERPVTARSWIHLQDVDFKQAMDVYGVLTSRTLLVHPEVSKSAFSCEGGWDSQSPYPTMLGDCFAKSFNQRETAAIEDGDCFLQIIPQSMAESTILGAKDLPVQKRFSGLIDFEGVPKTEVLDIYSKLINRKCENGESATGRFPDFRTDCPLSKAQTTYALETLFRWSGTTIELKGSDSFTIASKP